MFKSILRGLISLALCLNIALVPTLAQADVAAAFKSLLNDGATTSVTAPGQFSSQARNSFVAGGLDVRFPNRAVPQILSVTPFRIQAGCGGISLFFGGFSFISGSEIVALIKAVAQNAIGLAVELVMTTLCGPCASVMQIMRQLALAAANKALDSCQIAKTLMSGAQSYVSAHETTQDTCTQMGTLFGDLSDASQAQAGNTNICTEMSSAINTASKDISKALQKVGISPTSPLGQKELCSKQVTCNTMWTLLNQTDLYDDTFPDNIRDKLLLMNITGTNIKTANNALAQPINKTAPAASTAAMPNTASSAFSSSTGSLWVPSADSTLANGGTTTAYTVPLSPGLTIDTSGGSSSTSSSSTSTSTASTTPDPGVSTTATAGPNEMAPMLGNLSKSTSNNIPEVFKLLECGINGISQNPTLTDANAQSLINRECGGVTNSDGSVMNLAQLPVYDCADSTASGFSVTDSGYGACTQLYIVPLANTLMATDEGYLYYVANLLFGGVAAVQNNTALDPALIALIQEVPVPIYQAINVSAVYPDAGYQLISSMTVVVAQMLIYQHIRDLVQVAGRFHNDLAIQQADFDRILGFFAQMNAAVDAKDIEVSRQIARQQIMMQQIRAVNLAIQNEVMTPELLGAHRYGTALNSTVAQ